MSNDIKDVLRCESLPAIVYVYDLIAGNTIYQNRHLARELGYSKEEAERMGNDILGHLLHPEEFQQIPALLSRWDHANDGDIIETEHRLRHKNGQWRWFLGRDVVFNRDHTGKVTQILGTSFDITQRKLLEERLRHAQKLEAVGQLAGGIAHDFNNLLTSILGNVSLALSSAEDHKLALSDLGECLKEIELASRSASILTQQLLSFASKQVLRKETINTNLSIVDSARLIRSMVGESISLDLSLSADTPHIYFDPGQFTQLLLNLAINARDAMPRGGKLSIQSFAEPAVNCETPSNADVKAPIDADLPSESNRFGHAKIIISDTGTGIDKSIQERIFEPYFTTKSKGKGTGLGLATVYGIVTQSSGTIEVKTSSEGTKFLMCFPGTTPIPSAEVALMKQTKSSWKGFRVLIIEDSMQVASVLTAMLEREGFLVTVKNDGPEALEHVDQAHRLNQNRISDQAHLTQPPLTDTPYHLIVTDVVLPHLSGPDVVKQLRQRWPNLPVLFLSGYAPQEHNPELHQPNTAFLSKPVDATQLRAKLATLL